MLAVGTSREIPGLLFVFFLKGCSASEARQAVGTNGVWVTCVPEGLSTPLWCGQASYPYGGTCAALDQPGIWVGGRGEGRNDHLSKVSITHRKAAPANRQAMEAFEAGGCLRCPRFANGVFSLVFPAECHSSGSYAFVASVSG